MHRIDVLSTSAAHFAAIPLAERSVMRQPIVPVLGRAPQEDPWSPPQDGHDRLPHDAPLSERNGSEVRGRGAEDVDTVHCNQDYRAATPSRGAGPVGSARLD